MITIGLIIEGVAPTGQNGIVFHYGPNPGNILTSYLWSESMVQPPDLPTESCVPMSGELTASAPNFILKRDAVTAEHIVNLTQSTRTTYALASDYSVGDTTVTLNTTDFSSGDRIWVGDSCFALGSNAGAVYDILPDIADTDDRDYRSGTLVWPFNPYLHRRRFRLFVYREGVAGTRTVARGYIESISENAAGLIDIATQSLASLLSGAVLNKGANRWILDGRINVVGSPIISGPELSRIHRANKTPGTIVSIQGADTLFQAQVINSRGLWLTFAGGARNMPIPAPVPEHEDLRVVDDNAHEVFVVLPIASRSSTRDLETDITGGARNRLAIAYGFLRAGVLTGDSAWNRWTGVWGLGLKSSDIDAVQIQALIATTSPDVDQMILGVDGEEVPLSDAILTKLMLPAGYHLASREDGQIRFASYRLPTLDDLDQAPLVTALAGTLDIDYQIGHEVTSITAEVGALPWSDPDRITYDIVTGFGEDTTRQTAYESGLNWTLDYSTWAKSREELVPELLDRLRTQARRAFQVKLTALPLDSDTYDLGRWYLLDIDLTGPEGQPWDLSEAARLGYLIGRRYNIDRGTYDLTFLMNTREGRVARLIAPAAEITSSGTSTVVPCAPTDGFAIGDVVQRVSSSGTTLGAGQTIMAVGASSVTLSTSVAFTAGQVLRLNDFASYSAAVDPRRWAYIADATDELIDDTDTADIYG